MKLTLTVFILLFLLSACSSPDYHGGAYAERFKEHGYSYTPKSDITDHSDQFKVNGVLLKKYANRLSFELAQQVDVQSLPPIVVTSFVNFDQSLQSVNPLGNRLSEDLHVAMRAQGFKVIDRHATSQIKITEHGSFVFDRQSGEDKQVQYVLSGIIHYTPKSANVNARLLALSSGTIIAAYTLPIPNFVLQNAFPVLEGQDIIIKTK